MVLALPAAPRLRASSARVAAAPVAARAHRVRAARSARSRCRRRCRAGRCRSAARPPSWKALTPTMSFSLAFDRALVGVGGVHDLALREAGLDRLHHAAQLVDAAEVLEGAVDHALRHLLDELAAAERIDGVDDPRLVGDDLLRAQRDARVLLGRQRVASRRARWCAATGCRRAPPPAPGSRCARRC